MATNEELLERIQGLEAAVENLRGEVEARKRGQRLAAEESDIYETAWEQENGKLKEHLKAAVTLIENLAKDGPRPNSVFVSEHLKMFKDAVLQKVGNNEFEDFDTELTIDILGLVVHCEIPYETVALWTREQKMEAERWAAQQHAIASDNEFDESEIVAKPVHVRKLEEENPPRDDLHAVDLSPRVRTEPPWLTWAHRMKDSPKEWERLLRIEQAARATRSAFRHPDRDKVASAMCRVIDEVETERIQEFQGRDWTHGGQRKKKKS